MDFISFYDMFGHNKRVGVMCNGLSSKWTEGIRIYIKFRLASV